MTVDPTNGHRVPALGDVKGDGLIPAEPLPGLVKVAHGQLRTPADHAAVGRKVPKENPQQRGFPHAVVAHDADAIAPDHL